MANYKKSFFKFPSKTQKLERNLDIGLTSPPPLFHSFSREKIPNSLHDTSFRQTNPPLDKVLYMEGQIFSRGLEGRAPRVPIQGFHKFPNSRKFVKFVFSISAANRTYPHLSAPIGGQRRLETHSPEKVKIE